MNISAKTAEYVSEVERFAQRKFLYHYEIAALLELSSSNTLQSVMDEVVFYAKFLSKSHDILRREGIAADDTQKLAQEYSANLVKTTELIRKLFQDSPEDIRQKFERHFFSLTHTAMADYIVLLNELSWLKNYAVDTKA